MKSRVKQAARILVLLQLTQAINRTHLIQAQVQLLALTTHQYLQILQPVVILLRPPTGNTTPAVPNTSPPDTVANNPVTNPSTGAGSSNQNNNNNNQNNNGNQSGNNTSNNNSGNSTGQTNLGGGTTTTETEPPPLCTKEGSTEETPEITEDKSQVKEEDKGIFGSLWDDFKAVVKDTVIAGYEFIKGFWEGMKAQIADLANLLTNPKEVVMGLIELGKQFVKEPAKTAKMIADSLGDEFKTLALCGAYDKGRVIGSNISPAFMVKFATKMASFGGDVKRALNSTKKDFGCASFAAGAPIWTPDGKVNIETLVKGNTVLSRARLTYQDKPQTIEKTFGRTAPHYYQLTTEFGTINVTEEHPIWKQSRGWTEVQYLKVDDIVASADGDVLVLDNKKVDKPIEVYNFSVENTPSYFAGAGKLWVHNANCDLAKPSALGNGNINNVPIAKNYPTATKGLLGEAKTNQALKDKGLTPMGDTNIDPSKLNSKDGWSREMTVYNGSTGIDGIFRGKDGKIYIVESKTTGVSEGCKAGSLCNTKTGKQMSRDWLLEKDANGVSRLEKAGLTRAEIRQVTKGLNNNDGSVTRLYSGTNSKGETHFYEIKDNGNSSSDVKVDRANNEYKF